MKTLMELGKNECRYTATSGGKPADYLFCAAETKDGATYCTEHEALCIRIQVKKKDKPARENVHNRNIRRFN